MEKGNLFFLNLLTKISMENGYQISFSEEFFTSKGARPSEDISKII